LNYHGDSKLLSGCSAIMAIVSYFLVVELSWR
jgi:hypothetical protein